MVNVLDLLTMYELLKSTQNRIIHGSGELDGQFYCSMKSGIFVYRKSIVLLLCGPPP